MPDTIVEREITLTDLRAYVLRGEDCKDLAAADAKDPSIFRTRILLLSPGTWNDTDFTSDEIKAAVKRANDINGAAGAYRIPVMNGHNDDMTDIYGKTIAVKYGKAQTPDGEREGAIFDLECKSNMPPGDKIRDLMDWAPELVRYSARLRGQYLMPQSAKDNIQLVNFNFVHVGTVPDPACSDAGIVEQLARRLGIRKEEIPADQAAHPDFDLSASAPDSAPMATQDDKIAQLERENADLKTKVSDLETKLKQKDEQVAAKDAELQKAAKAPLVTSILALHKDADQKFLDSMSLEQLAAYEADLKKMVPAPASGTTEKSLSGGGAGQKSPKEISLARAERIFGPVRGR